MQPKVLSDCRGSAARIRQDASVGHSAIVSILYVERRAVLRARLAPVVQPGRGDIRVTEPFLDLGDVRFVRERVRRRRRPHGMHADADGLGADTRGFGVFHDYVLVHRAGIEMPI